MARFNTPRSGPRNGPTATNLAGGNAFSQSARLELVSLLATSMLKEQFYRSADDQAKALNDVLLRLNDPRFAAKAALFARNRYGMRSITHLAAVGIAAQMNSPEMRKADRSWLRKFFEAVARRPDDILEILAVMLSSKQKLTNAMRDGFGKALARFDAYQLAKYRKAGAQVNLMDAVNLLHPPATDALTQLMKGTLPAADTWETRLTQAGQVEGDSDAVDEAKREAWATLIGERRIGYFALLRNLRNIATQAPEALPEALAMLVDPKLIRNSLVLPFRFFSAYHELSAAQPPLPEVLKAINAALELSLVNVPRFPGRTLVVVDHSASMGNGYESNFVKGALFGVMLARSQEPAADFMHFGSRAQYLAIDETASLLHCIQWLDEQNKRENGRTYVDHGTDFEAIFATASRPYERIVIFSDMQGWLGREAGAPVSAHRAYCQKFKCNPTLFLVDLAGYGTAMFPEKRSFQLAGYSEKIFEVMRLLETDPEAFFKAVEEVAPEW